MCYRQEKGENQIFSAVGDNFVCLCRGADRTVFCGQYSCHITLCCRSGLLSIEEIKSKLSTLTKTAELTLELLQTKNDSFEMIPSMKDSHDMKGVGRYIVGTT